MSRQAKQPSRMRMERELRKLGRNLDGLVARTREAQSAARVRYAEQLRTLTAKRAKAKQMLAQLRRRSAAASGPLKAGLVKAWAELSVAVNKARQRFRETS